MTVLIGHGITSMTWNLSELYRSLTQKLKKNYQKLGFQEVPPLPVSMNSPNRK